MVNASLSYQVRCHLIGNRYSGMGVGWGQGGRGQLEREVPT